MSVNLQPKENAMSSTTNIILLAIAAVFGVLYMMRRRARLHDED